MNKIIIPLISLLFLMGCTSIKTNYDYNGQVDFTKYKTYNYTDFQPVLEESVGLLNSDRIIKNIEANMALKGFTKSDTPDILVDVFIKSKQIVEATATTTGSGPYRYGRGYTTTDVDYNEYTEGTMFITFVDNASQKMVWQGTGTKTLVENASAEKREASISNAVKMILANYPPVKKHL